MMVLIDQLSPVMRLIVEIQLSNLRGNSKRFQNVAGQEGASQVRNS
jgi:hypothetical protein